MAWSNPRTWTTGEVVTAAHMNTEVRDNLNALSRGQLGYAQVTSNQAGITGGSTNLTGLSVLVTVGTSRRIRVTGHGTIIVGTDGDRFRGFIAEGAAALGAWIDHRRGGNASVVAGDGSIVLTPSAGDHTYKLVLNQLVGTGSATLEAATTHPAFILVEDLGPA